MFTKEDELILEALKNVVHGLATFLGDDCEVVLHSFKDVDHSIVAIENGHITGRQIGSTLTEAGSKIIKDVISHKKDIVGPYKSFSPNGRILRSVTIPIRNKRKLIGLLCINMDISKFLQTEDFLKTFLSFENPRNTNDLQKVGSALLSNLKEQIFEETMLMVETKGPIRRRDKNRIIVKNLYGQDFFALKDSVEFVAKKLGVSIFTIYKYIKELKEMKGG